MNLGTLWRILWEVAPSTKTEIPGPGGASSALWLIRNCPWRECSAAAAAPGLGRFQMAQVTPASSTWPQLVLPQPENLHCWMASSVPVQATSSIQIRPVPAHRKPERWVIGLSFSPTLVWLHTAALQQGFMALESLLMKCLCSPALNRVFTASKWAVLFVLITRLTHTKVQLGSGGKIYYSP